MNQLYPAPVIEQDKTQYPLAKDEVCHVGQTVAVVVADSRAIAEDALALIDVDYESLPAVVDIRTALDDGAPVAHADTSSNLLGRLRHAFGRQAARRVGKGCVSTCRSRWPAEHSKKKTTSTTY